MEDERKLAQKIMFDTLDLGIYFDTDEEEVQATVELLTNEIKSLDKNSCLYHYLVDKFEEQEVNPKIWKNFFREDCD